jgi:hypothetical protein
MALDGDYYFSGTSPDGQILTIAPVTDDTANDNDLPMKGRYGYFLQEGPSGERRLIARLHDEEAAFTLARWLGLK